MNEHNKNQPRRRHPAHPPPIEYQDRPTLLLVTLCVRDRRPLLAHADIHELLRRSWTIADRWLVGRYIIMPDHLHLFCSPADRETRLMTWIEFWRAWCTRHWPRRVEKPIWQKDYWDTQLRRGESYSAKWDYVCNNAVKAGLVQDLERWPYQGEMNVLPWLER